MHLGCSTWGMPRTPVEVALREIARLGYTAVELTVLPNYTANLDLLGEAERRGLRDLLRELSLDLPAIAGHSNLIAADPAEYAVARDRLRRAADLAAELAGDGAHAALNTTAGHAPGSWDDLRGLLVDRLGDLVDYCSGKGVVVAIEPHVGGILDSPDRALWLIDQFRSPWLKLNFDYSHFEAAGLPMEATIAALAPHSVHSHVKDVRGRAPDHEFLIPGESDLDYAAFLRAMQAAGYTGAITVEISVMVQRRPGYDPLAAIAQSYEALSAAFRAAGLTPR